jgi:dihydrofolate reductase
VAALLSLIVAMDSNRLIGRGNALPWHLPADLKHFKSITMSKPIIMGRKTYESIGKPLPGRRNIVITRNPNYQAPGCDVVTSLDAALKAAGNVDEIMIIGGTQIFQESLPVTQRIYLTLIDHEFEGDAWFPEYDLKKWKVSAEEKHRHQDSDTGFEYKFLQLDRVR